MKEKVASLLLGTMIFVTALVYNTEVWNIENSFHIIYLIVMYCSLYSLCFLVFRRLGKLGWIGILAFYFIGFGLTYFYYVYKRTLSYDVLAAILEADAFEVSSFLSPLLILMALGALFCASFHIYGSRFIKISNKKFFVLLIALSGIFIGMKEGGKFYIDKTNPDSSLRYYLGTRNIVPLSFFAVMQTYYVEEKKSTALLSLPLASDFPSECNEKEKPIVILVLGESARGDHFRLNGYGRDTNPLLSNETNIINLGIARSFDIQTRKSLIGLLTNASEAYRKPTIGSFISLYNKHQFVTCFFSRQNKLGRSGHLTDALVSSSQQVKYLRNSADQDMIPYVQEVLDKYDDGILILLHTTGSHYDYHKNYTAEFRRFIPDDYTPESMMEHRQNVINAYDNTIVKTDDFLFKLYDILRERDAVVLYVSDHGQLLGEHERFLHAIGGTGITYPEQKNIPFFFWYSDSFAAKRPKMIQNLKSAAASGKTFTHDYVYHTMISLGGISSSVVETPLDLTLFGVQR